MADVDFTRTVALPAFEAWRRLTTFTDHGNHVPLTRVRLIDPAAPGGGGFIARTELAGVGFDDVNVIELWQPPASGAAGVCELRKTGRLVGGWARLTVSEIDPSRAGSADPAASSVRWEETITVPGVPTFLSRPVCRAFGPKVFGRVVDALMSAR